MLKHLKVLFVLTFLMLDWGLNPENGFCKVPDDKLWYLQPAKEWLEALPIGNGRLGAMVFGGINEETIALNESTMWSGQVNENQNIPFGNIQMEYLRNQFFKGDIAHGNHIAESHLIGDQSSFGTHLPIGYMKVKFFYPEGIAKDYCRSLSLDEAICTVAFNINGVNYKREYFCTNPDSVLIARFTADKSRAITFDLNLDLMRPARFDVDEKHLIFSGKVDFPLHGPGGVDFEGRIGVLADNGNVSVCKEGIYVKNADAVTVVVDIRTDYKNADYRRECNMGVRSALAHSYSDLKNRHIKDYSTLYNRVTLNLGEDIYKDLPTDIRKNLVEKGQTDVGLDVLFFQFGRYLTIASSRENSPLPIALQGFFNDNKACNMGWCNDYHLDINTEQNYWATNVGNLAECNLPLFRYIGDLAYYGAKTAEVVYGCKGWTAHTTANVWGYTAPSSCIYWGLFPTAGSWIATHLWTQYEYTQDKEFLVDIAYPLLKGNADFLLDYLVTDPLNGYLMSGPSISPENAFGYHDGEYCASMMPTVDRELVYEIFSSCIEAAEILDIDQSFRDSLHVALNKLPPIQLCADGSLREWFEDYQVVHPNHRHTSHLLALYPFSQITLERTPELAEGARKSIDNRISASDWEDTEWSRANLLCFYARLKDARNAYNSVQSLLSKCSRANLMTVSPKGIAGAEEDIYSFDGNPAGTAGMAEMLVQNHEGYIDFLPCLPIEWKDGSFSGLCLRGGVEVSANWRDAILNNAFLKVKTNRVLKVKLPQERNYQIKVNGCEVLANQDGQGLICICVGPGDLCEIKSK